MKVSDLNDEDYATLERYFDLKFAPSGWIKDSLILDRISHALEVKFVEIPLLIRNASFTEACVYKFRLEKGL